MPHHISARHALVESEGKCRALHEQHAAAGGQEDDFAALAHAHSTCPSSANGGDLGRFSPGQMVPEFDAVLFKLEPGQVSSCFKTPFGWHVALRTS
jgi:peptidyl-prolyl cis-trans isomerase C